MADAKRIAEEGLKAGATAAVTAGCPMMGVAVGAAIYAPEQTQAALDTVSGADVDDEGDEG
jgi:hypothetical protein